MTLRCNSETYDMSRRIAAKISIFEINYYLYYALGTCVIRILMIKKRNECESFYVFRIFIFTVRFAFDVTSMQ